MAVGAFLFKIPDSSPGPFINGVTVALVGGSSESAALATLKTAMEGNGDFLWDAAEGTALGATSFLEDIGVIMLGKAYAYTTPVPA